MSAADLQALTDDIEVNGQRDPIVIYEGMVIDGWHRYQACTSLCLPVDERQLPADEDPVAYVKSRNLHRRHLTEAQRGEAVVACSAWQPAHRPNKLAPGASLTNAQMAKEANVGARTIERAKVAHAAGLGEAVRDGKLSLKRANEIAKLPAPEREAAIDVPKPAAKNAEKKAAPIVEPEAAKAITSLKALLADSAKNHAETLADNESMAKIFEAEDRLVEALEQVRQLRAENRVLRERRDGLQSQCNEQIRTIKSLRAKLQKFGVDA